MRLAAIKLALNTSLAETYPELMALDSAKYQNATFSHQHCWRIPIAPRHAWEGLRSQGVSSVDQLKAVDNRLERIGPKTPQLVRFELARIELP